MMEQKVDGLILDVDGTLWDSTGIVAGSWERAARESGIADFTVTTDQLKGLFGKTMDHIAEELFPDQEKERRDRIMDLCCGYEHDDLEANERDICYPEVIDGIKRFSAQVPVFIVSNCQSGYIELFLRKTGLAPYVKDIECFGNTGKSKGENIADLAARNHLQTPVYVGDTQGDCDAARAAGVPFIFASYGFGAVDRCDAQIAGFAELEKFLS